MEELVRLVAIRDVPLDLAEVSSAVEDETYGAVSVFVGTVRDHDAGKQVGALEYTAHPTAIERLQEVCAAVADKHAVRVAAVHRTGPLEIGDVAVIVATGSPHRGTAFDATRELIDTLKAQVPIWKHQVFADGTSEWVGSP